MADKDVIIQEKVEKTGIFSFKDAYAYAFDWFKEEDYGLVEEKYQEKVAGSEREIAIVWKATKKVGDYFKVEMGVEYEVSNLVDVEVEIDGKKQKSNKGRIVMKIKGVLIKDPDSDWDSSPFNKFIRGIYDKYIIKKTIGNMEDKVSGDVQGFKEHMKTFFELTGKQ